jgi:MerR family transcriptional regulator/heat shock protein HspR
VTAAFEDPTAAIYTIGQVSELLGVQAAFLRRVETESLVRPARSDGGQRRYSRNEIDTLQHIAQLASDGMTLAGIRRILVLEAEVAELQRRIAAAETDGAA